MKTAFLILGILALLMGLLWIGQGTGTINWPQSSFMIKQIQWAGYGAALAALGLVLIWQSERQGFIWGRSHENESIRSHRQGGRRHRRQWRHRLWHGVRACGRR